MISSIAIKVFHKQSRLEVFRLVSSYDLSEHNLQWVNYYLGVEIIAESLQPCGIIMDLGICKQELKRIISLLNKKLILSNQDSQYIIEEGQETYKLIIKGDFFYEVPKNLCVMVDKKTAPIEDLSEFIGTFFVESLKLKSCIPSLLELRVFVSESRECSKPSYIVKF
ncbi:hypothetical protein SteCoe_13197 [Stentor coeruleus]|uniref:6-pyruvoyltetrahydropterin synthase n=1 Tax=Stentor coeruleus TaxID=5963 RepID=A0A1R2C963_9CILI|nr:hypothetical protein SteCoe_13197 [Stentor coeruleus]